MREAYSLLRERLFEAPFRDMLNGVRGKFAPAEYAERNAATEAAAENTLGAATRQSTKQTGAVVDHVE